MTTEQKARLFKTEDLGLYVVAYNEIKSLWELRRKLTDTDRTLFIKSCLYKSPLLIVANNLQVAR